MAPEADVGSGPSYRLAPDSGATESWMKLLGDGSIRRLHLDLEQVNSAFAVSGDARAALWPEQGAPEETFIDLYAALATAPPSAVACCKQSNTYGTADRRVKDAGKG